jgi:cell division protein FtsI/penicillin-binding protein 2
LIEDSIKPAKGRQVISPATSKTITNMLVNIVDKIMVNGTVKLPHFSIAAKTGTAQIAKPGGGGYQENIYLHSFFGYFPASNPRFIVLLMAVRPKGVTYASQTLISPFFDVTKFLINYYELPPDR